MLLFILLLSIFINYISAYKLHPEITVCKRNDPQLSECFKANFIKILPYLHEDYPDMNLMALEPVIIDHVRLDMSESDSVHLVCDLNNIHVHGMSETRVDGLRAWLTPEDTIAMDVALTMPALHLTSGYKALGKFLVLAINTKGTLTMDFQMLHVQSQWTSKRYAKDGKEHLHLSGEIVSMTFDDVVLHFENIFGAHAELNDAINLVVNKNIHLLYDEVRPMVLDAIRGVVERSINNVYDVFSYNELFPVD